MSLAHTSNYDFIDPISLSTENFPVIICTLEGLLYFPVSYSFSNVSFATKELIEGMFGGTGQIVILVRLNENHIILYYC